MNRIIAHGGRQFCGQLRQAFNISGRGKRFLPKPSRLALAIVTGLAVTVTAAFADDTPAPTPGARKSPDWLKNSVVYEIFPRNFSPSGDLNSITARLDELKDLGVDVLWLMPIHPIGEKMKKGSLGSPFSVRDFYAINPDYGTTNDFKRLIAGAHQRGMKVVMDVVAGQTSWDSVLMAHPDFYLKDANGNITPPDPAWTDVAGLNYANPAVRRYMIDMMKHWLADYGVDGFRCDVAPNVPQDFWEAARAELEKVNPQVIILADAGAKASLLTNAFDVDSSWNLRYTVDCVMDSQEPAYYVQGSWQHTHDQYPDGALHLRFTDNHEVPRAIARYGVNGALAAEVMMLTLDGVPLLYNGMEVGDATESADPALFEKMPIFWQPGGRPRFRDIYRDLIKLRKQSTALTTGELDWVSNSLPDSVVSYVRKGAKDEYLVLINFSSEGVIGSLAGLSPDGFEAVKINGWANPVDANLPDFQLIGYGWCIFHRSVKQ